MILGLFSLVVFAMQNAQGQATSQYRITHTYTLGGDGRWDYVTPDPANHRVFIARQNRFMVVDETDGKVLGEVAPIQGAHGVALVPAAHHGFAVHPRELRRDNAKLLEHSGRARHRRVRHRPRQLTAAGARAPPPR